MTNFAVLGLKVSVFHAFTCILSVLYSTTSQVFLSKTDQSAMVPIEKKMNTETGIT